MFKIPYSWSEQDCKNAINQLLTESNVRYEKNKFDEAAKMLIAAARIMKEIPSRHRKESKKVLNKVKKEETSDLKNDIDESPNPFKVV